ncbi:uncharacterized serpin-like protein TK1782 [Trichonephila inaurata madagascariensis]|uniref:Uncharacterized serpin-like protein TK1782 n=1 Tax=Trichonephila inaurata madagascariensis TaxID=2747483 RepID=A0A8X6IFC1_9ARAC|nr:uncharacterized serpin-like protein TK1782 [Trichonephila inaurata madagascariensis]
MIVANASNHLGIHLYKWLAKEKRNVFFSPFSVSTALAMLFFGSEKKTNEEMRSVLGYETANIKDERLKSCFQKLLDSLESNPDSYNLACANSVLTDKEFSVKKEYKSLLIDFFNACVEEVDFMNENEKALNRINEWVSEKTHGMIPKMLESIDPSTVMVILNAIYFKGFWLEQFDENETILKYFNNKGEENNYKEVDTMHIKKKFMYVEEETYKALQLPYKGGDIAMLILLPNLENGLEELESSLNSSFFEDLKHKMKETKVEVELPKFQLEYEKSLKECFKELGINKIFHSEAELGNISNSENIFVSDIIHKAAVVVNEEGSEATASTVVEIVAYCMSFDPEFFVDHPFLFLIYNTENDLILFMGRVNEL